MKNKYKIFRTKIMKRFCLFLILAFFLVISLYFLLWHQRGGNTIVELLSLFPGISYEKAYWYYHLYFRNYKELYFITGIFITFAILLGFLFHWITGYFHEINQGIDSLLTESPTEIHLSPEMHPLEEKLNLVKRTLTRQARDKQLAEQRKNDLVMYLAHDIRTPLTSVIGYLNLLTDCKSLQDEYRNKYLQITLSKAYRLEKMINEFFEITRYNSQQISLNKTSIDLHYMLIQLTDELTPLLSSHGNYVSLHLAEDISVFADPDKLARVFSNLLKNAATYSYPNTEIIISAGKSSNSVHITFQNEGEHISEEKLSSLFEKFYRLDESRSSETGGTGLGLAIAQDIITLHNGTIHAESKNNKILFTIQLPDNQSN